MSGRKETQGRVLSLLEQPDLQEAVDELRRLPPAQVIRALLSFLSRDDEALVSRAAQALGRTVADLTESDLEAGRNVLRRLLWSMNDESGSVVWGAPEGMAEILVRHQGLAAEYAHLLLGHLREEVSAAAGGRLERSLLHAVTRLAEARPALLRSLGAAGRVRPFLQSREAAARELAARAIALLEDEGEGSTHTDP
ncbi:MAG: DVU0298 family protein [bacterium]